MITRINEKWDPISWGWLSQNTFHTTSTVLVANLIPRRLGKEFYYTSGISSYILLIKDMVVKRCNRRFGCETIHPTQKFTSMNLLQMPCVITWA